MRASGFIISAHTMGDGRPTREFIVTPAGDLDLATAPMLREALVSALLSYEAVTCDLSQVAFIDASGLTALIQARQVAHRNGHTLRLRGSHGPVDRVLRLTGLRHALIPDA